LDESTDRIEEHVTTAEKTGSEAGDIQVTLAQAAATLTAQNPFNIVFDRGDEISVELYAPIGRDNQTPHERDELYRGIRPRHVQPGRRARHLRARRPPLRAGPCAAPVRNFFRRLQDLGDLLRPKKNGAALTRRRVAIGFQLAPGSVPRH